MNQQIERMKGWIECAQYFFPSKNKKGSLDPKILIMIILILVVIVIWIQKG